MRHQPAEALPSHRDPLRELALRYQAAAHVAVIDIWVRALAKTDFLNSSLHCGVATLFTE
jgi:hypothetical protein